ncbi:hypothetical protein FHT40_006336 [Mycolicibacterium sp. BK556]|uniref:CHAT domain-containing protein n=1 Tax=Mycobacteriaceae TaxID=1762 RepID=UPI000D3B9815|nr:MULTISPECIES: CHAT domain-containing protein [Mycobacteriaceae]MBB3606645.1 hypothetical protein [Mycolicibacterium sp. BK556]MBB3636108.1 hypothetical protein [Mycolicibacterium sp. BK607]MBB3753736.1 hypothetical protein [Mycolicibacterium sp. BK634]TDO06583.1 CHAT domain-containing protein [Mycobacterium sp. BK086]
MTARIVFCFQKLRGLAAQQPLTTLSVREPTSGDWDTYDLNLFDISAVVGRLGQQTDNTATGSELFNALYTGETVRKVLDARTTLARNGRRVPMYFDLTAAEELHDFAWEMLWKDDKFLTLEKWPIGRMLQSDAGKVLTRSFAPPFRIAAVLSSLGVDSRNEWQSLHDAIAASTADVRVLLLMSDTDLHDELYANGPPWLTVGLVPVKYVDLQSKITEFGPHILHLFCHGSTLGGAHLEIATANDIAAGAQTSGHRLEARQVRDLVRPGYPSPWAIVLNACSTADNPDQSGARSLADLLVREQGIQAVVGMRKPVLDTDAATFTRTFYQSMLDQMRSLMAKEGTCELDWATLTIDARRQLCPDQGQGFDHAATTTQKWTLPVVIVRPDRFRFKVPADPTVARAADKAQLAEQILAQMDLPPEIKRNMTRPPDDDGAGTTGPSD